MSLSLFIARRIYRESDGGKQVSRPAVLIAMAGIAIGLAVMIIAVAVVIGFKSEVRNKVIGFGSHIQITNLDAVSSYETHPIVVGDSIDVGACRLSGDKPCTAFFYQTGYDKDGRCLSRNGIERGRSGV